jgi:hypothetical protein
VQDIVVVVPLDRPGEPGWARAGSITEVETLSRGGHVVEVVPALLAGSDDPAAELAAAALCAWAGASVFRTARPEAVRQAVEMTECLAGRRPPVLARRGPSLAQLQLRTPRPRGDHCPVAAGHGDRCRLRARTRRTPRGWAGPGAPVVPGR